MTPESISRAVGNPGLAEELIASIAVGLADSPMSTDRDPLSRLDSAIKAVMLDLDTHKKNGLLKALISADWDSTDTDVVDCLNFIKSQIVNKFKGYLGEFLAMRLCTELAQEWKRDGRLPPSAQIVWGTDIRQRERVAGAWLQGADGLLLVEEQQASGPIVVIFGVIEVKAYRGGTESQVEKHIARLRHGLRIGGAEWFADRIFIGRCDRGRSLWSKTAVISTPRPAALRLRVRPSLARTVSRPEWRGDTVSASVPYTSDVLAAVAYSMSIWFIEQLGARAFEATASPWPDMTAEAAGVNAVKQALYYISLRNQLPLREQGIAARLYNVYGFGYEFAKGHKDLIWNVRGELVSGSRRPKTAGAISSDKSLKDATDRAWSFYRTCEMDKALAEIAVAMEMTPGREMERRLRWLQSMIHYFLAEFDQISLEFLVPPSGPRNESWARNKLTVTRTLVRLGRLDEADREAEEVSEAALPARFVPISLRTCAGVIALKRAREEEARQSLEAAFSMLQAEYEDIQNRESQGLGVHRPWAPDRQMLGALAIDMLPAFVTLGCHTRAIELLGYAHGVFRPYLLLLSRDPELDALRRDPEFGPRFVAWLEQEGLES